MKKIKIRDKKGAEFTISTLVIIVLAIIVLVVLALGFGTGWSNLWSKITGYFSPVNVDSISQACSYACTTQAKFDYCCRVREVRFDKDQEPKLITCNKDQEILSLDCDLSCDKETCGDLVCKGNVDGGDLEVLDITGEDEESDICKEGTVQEGKKLSSDLKPIKENQRCCVED